jgi:hypothetical protein
MSEITSREEFKNYCLRRLGFPVIDINIDDDQVEDRIDDAIQYFIDRHTDGTQKLYYVKRIQQEDIDNKYINLDPTVVQDSSNNSLDIVGVTRIFPIQDSQATINMFDLRYQLRLNELYDFTSASYINYTLTMQHLRSLELMFTGEVPIRYNRHMRRLYIDWAWGEQEAPIGQALVVECYATLNPEVYTNMWNDRWLKRYATALIKRNWGENLKKFKGLKLPGDVTLNADEIYQDAKDEIKELEDQMESEFGGILEFFMN